MGETPTLVAAEVVGDTFRYVLKVETPARFLSGGTMSHFLYDFRFGEKGRKMVVRLLDDLGRFAWAAGYDGAGKAWARARRGLARCLTGSIPTGEDGRRFKLPTARRAADEPLCWLEHTLVTKSSTANATTVTPGR